MRSFTQYAETKDVLEVKEHLVKTLIESNVDILAFNRGLQIISEYEYNPARTGLEVGATAAGATLGSALGPLGTVGGGLIGGMAGKAVSSLAGKYMSGVQVDPIHPIHMQAKDAVDKLLNLIQKSGEGEGAAFYKDSQRQKYVGSIKKIKDYFDTTAKLPQQIDQERNQKMDADLRQRGEEKGTSISGALKKIEGEGKIPQFMRWLGKKVENIPVLNQEMGLRRAIAKGMDALQVWAKENPKKAAVLNTTAGIAGAAAGVGAAGGFSGPSAAPTQNKSDSVTSRDAGDFIQRPGVVQSRDPFPSGRIDNSAAFSDNYTRTYTPNDAIRPRMSSPEELWRKFADRRR